MTADRDDDEWRRFARERDAMSAIDRIHGAPPRNTADGFIDQRSQRRTGRVILMPFRVHPRVKALILAIKARDNIPSLPVFLEEMLEVYQEKYGPIAEKDLPTDEQLAAQIERERDKRDAL